MQDEIRIYIKINILTNKCNFNIIRLLKNNLNFDNISEARELY